VNPNINLLTKFLKACPDSVKDLTIRSETTLHIAVCQVGHQFIGSTLIYLSKIKEGIFFMGSLPIMQFTYATLASRLL